MLYRTANAVCDAIVLALISVTPNRGRLWEELSLEPRRPAT
ncbi:hypothetical protein C7S15_8312 [Burkholderia cepacia]|nr:hypothetical protein [Burkholderia cepacia]